jgi:CBS domain-containing protein
MRVGEVMTPTVYTVGASEPAAAAWELMRLHRVRHLVVTDKEGRVSGILSASDLGDRHGESLRDGRSVADLMTEKVVAATPATTVREAANLMRGHAVNCLPVFKGEKLQGIVTTLDLLSLIGRGAERPVAKTKRWVLKDRGVQPTGLKAAKRAPRARRIS